MSDEEDYYRELMEQQFLREERERAEYDAMIEAAMMQEAMASSTPTNDIADAPTHACDECQVPVALTDLVPFKKTHLCRRCWEKYHETPGGKPDEK